MKKVMYISFVQSPNHAYDVPTTVSDVQRFKKCSVSFFYTERDQNLTTTSLIYLQVMDVHVFPHFLLDNGNEFRPL